MSPAELNAEANAFLTKIEEKRRRREVAKQNYLKVRAAFEETDNAFLRAHKAVNDTLREVL